MKKIIAIVYGGDSDESIISKRSAKTVLNHLSKEKIEGYLVKMMNNIWEVELPNSETQAIDRTDFSFVKEGNKIHFDGAFIVIHGTPGEDGKLQGYFDMIGMPYNTCNSLVSAVTFHKGTTIKLLKSMGFHCSNSIVLHKGKPWNAVDVARKLSLPYFVKPNSGGSSFGVTKVKEVIALHDAIENALSVDKEVMVEEFLEGREFTNGAFKKGDEIVVMPITEIIPKVEFFDFAAKYEGNADEITPASLTKKQTESIQNTTREIYEKFNLNGIIRIDYILVENVPFVIEINTTPGMSDESIIPQQASAMGLSLTELFGYSVDSMKFDYPAR